MGQVRSGQVRLGYLSITILLLVYSYPVISLSLYYNWFVLIPLQGLQVKCIVTINLAIYNFLPWVGHMTAYISHQNFLF